MNGLDKIIAQILDDAKQESLAIQEKAAGEAETTLAAAGEKVKKLEEDGADLVMSNPMILDMLDDCRHPYRNMLNFYRWSRMGGFPVEEQPLLLTCIGCWDKFYRAAHFRGCAVWDLCADLCE